ncbi:MAG: TlpA family protein disulfide reductase [Flavobacteriaceae bacterium]
MKYILFTFFYILSFNISLSQDRFPFMNIKTISGKTVNTKSTYNRNGLTVYSFWATWCVPCINELDDIHKEIDKWNDANVKIVAISTDDSRTKRRVRPMVNGKNWNFEILMDENQDLKRALNITGIPHTIVTKGSRIIYRRIGYKPGEENDLYEFIIDSQ